MCQLKDDILQDARTATLPGFRSRVWGVMFYLDGLFVSRSNVVPPDPSCVLPLGQACCWDRHQAFEWRNAVVKCIWGTAGEGSESVWSLESLRVLFHSQIHTYTFNHSHIPPQFAAPTFPHPLPWPNVTQCIWKQSRPASHDRVRLRVRVRFSKNIKSWVLFLKVPILQLSYFFTPDSSGAALHRYSSKKNPLKIPRKQHISEKAEPRPGWECCYWSGRGICPLWHHK